MCCCRCYRLVGSSTIGVIGPVYISTDSSERSSLPSHIPIRKTKQHQHNRSIARAAAATPTASSGRALPVRTMENKSASSSCVISPAATSTMSSAGGESSWAVHIANFLASMPQDDIGTTDDPQAAVSGGGGSFSSSFGSFGDASSFITSQLMCGGDDDDESLQDTACSSAAGQKMATMESFGLKQMAAMDGAKESNMPHHLQLMAKYVEAVGSKQQVTGVGDQQAINSSSNSEKALLYESNELRKRGLCLVPISMLINYLG